MAGPAAFRAARRAHRLGERARGGGSPRPRDGQARRARRRGDGARPGRGAAGADPRPLPLSACSSRPSGRSIFRPICGHGWPAARKSEATHALLSMLIHKAFCNQPGKNHDQDRPLHPARAIDLQRPLGAGRRVDPLHFDAVLSDLGQQQVKAAAAAVRAVPYELVITSPLTRAIQTTLGLFADHPAAPDQVECLHRERLDSSCDVGRSPGLMRANFRR